MLYKYTSAQSLLKPSVIFFQTILIVIRSEFKKEMKRGRSLTKISWFWCTGVCYLKRIRFFNPMPVFRELLKKSIHMHFKQAFSLRITWISDLKSDHFWNTNDNSVESRAFQLVGPHMSQIFSNDFWLHWCNGQTDKFIYTFCKIL